MKPRFLPLLLLLFLPASRLATQTTLRCEEVQPAESNLSFHLQFQREGSVFGCGMKGRHD